MRFNQKFNFQRETIQHPGLWFDKYLGVKNDKEDDTQQKQVHVKNVAALAEPSLYKKFYQSNHLTRINSFPHSLILY